MFNIDTHKHSQNKITLEDSQAIHQILEQYCKLKRPLLVWQDQGETVYTCWATLAFINDFKSELILRPRPTRLQFKFKNELPLYIKDQRGRLSFEGNIQTPSWRKYLKISIPQKVIAMEERRSPRSSLLDKGIQASFRNFTTFAPDNSPELYQFEIIDISSSGMAIKIPAEYYKYFETGHRIHLQKIHNYIFQEKIAGHVVYLQPFSAVKEHPKWFRLAIKFDYPLRWRSIFHSEKLKACA